MIRHVFAAAMASSLFSIPVRAAVNNYHMDARVERDNLITADSTVDVAEVVDADIQMRNVDGAVSSRIIARIDRADARSKDASVHLQYFEKRGGAWVLVGEPTLVLSPEAEGRATFPDARATEGHYTIVARVRPEPK